MPILKMPTSEMRQLFGTLDALAAIKFPTKGSYSISRALTKMKGEMETYREAQTKLFEQFGRKKEDGSMEVPKEAPKEASEEEKERVRGAFQEFEAAYKELDTAEVEIDVPYILLANLGDVAVEPALLYGIDKLLVEEIPT